MRVCVDEMDVTMKLFEAKVRVGKSSLTVVEYDCQKTIVEDLSLFHLILDHLQRQGLRGYPATYHQSPHRRDDRWRPFQWISLRDQRWSRRLTGGWL